VLVLLMGAVRHVGMLEVQYLMSCGRSYHYELMVMIIPFCMRLGWTVESWLLAGWTAVSDIADVICMQVVSCFMQGHGRQNVRLQLWSLRSHHDQVPVRTASLALRTLATSNLMHFNHV
jgi:hypothetical protein